MPREERLVRSVLKRSPKAMSEKISLILGVADEKRLSARSVAGVIRTEIQGSRARIRGFSAGSFRRCRSGSCPRAFDSGGQATKGAWGMSWHQEALKGAEGCDKPGETVKQVMIPGFPN